MPKCIATIVMSLLLLIVIFILLNDSFSFAKRKEKAESIVFNNRLMKVDGPYHLNKRASPQASLSKYTSEYFQAGMNILVYGQPKIEEAIQVFERLRQLGFNSLAINFPFYQESLTANEVTRDSQDTPTIQALSQLIDEAHQLGFSVMLRPIMDEEVFISEQKWRGQIQAENIEQWFMSYESFLLDYAELAQQMNVKRFNIGTELNSMEQYSTLWKSLIERVRDVYDGELIYSFNWDRVADIASVEFIDHLDYLGIDAYFPLHVADGASVDMLEEAWATTINEFKDKLPDKPIVVTEAGILPIDGAYRTPYAWHFPGGKLNLEAQANYYEATYKEWRQLSKGIYWWTVILGDEMTEINFSPFHSPTEEILKKQNLSFDFDEK